MWTRAFMPNPSPIFNLHVSCLLGVLLLPLATISATRSEQNQNEDQFVFEAGNHEMFNMQFRVHTVVQKRYLLYDANVGEGFNLRRDVYMRVANLIRRLREEQERRHEDWILVLPPWGMLYHWKSPIKEQMKIPWSHFFDVPSLRLLVDVIEFEDFLRIPHPFGSETSGIDLVYELQYYADTFKEDDDGDKIVDWVDKVDESECLGRPSYRMDEDGRFRGAFWGHPQVYARNFSCLSMQGPASTLVPLLRSKNASSIMLDRSEIMLHDGYGDAQYWKTRRSMRFAKRLIDVADDFRRSMLNSSDLTDRTELTQDWRLAKKSKGDAIGGPYLAVHLRRQDFLSARPKHVPSLANAAEQIRKIMERLGLTRVFVATDAPDDEFRILQEYLEGVVRFVSTREQLKELKDGGVAIIDQWICAHARILQI